MSLAQAQPAAVAPRFDRATAGVAPGARLILRLSGGRPPYVVVPSSSAFEVDLDSNTGSLTVTGLRPGSGTISVIDAAGASAAIPVLVAPAAGSLPAAVSLTLAGENLSPDFVNAQARAAILRAARPENGTTLSATGPGLDAPLQPGERFDERVAVALQGNGRFVDVAGDVAVHVQAERLPALEPRVLFYSDDPENIPAAADGVLFRDTLVAPDAARAYLYHTTLVPDRHLSLVLRAARGARVQLLGTSAGPSTDYVAAGHAATANYLAARRAQQSLVLEVDPAVPFVLPLSDRPLDANQLIAAVFDIRVLSGGPLEVSCVASTGTGDVAALLDAPRVVGDGHFRTGTYLLDAPLLRLSYSAGASEPAALSTGMAPVTALRATRPLGGAYGVVQRFELVLENPTAAPADIYLYEIPNGNALTTTLLFDGEAAPLEIPCVKTTGTRFLVRGFSLAAGEQRDVGGEYMTDGASSYPIQLGLGVAAPALPDGCKPAGP